MFNRIVRYFLENRLIALLLLIAFVAYGLAVMPFRMPLAGYPRDPVPVDAIPDLGENQQIVATEWMGRSPKDIQDQITYPLTTALMGIPGVKTIRSTSMFGMSFIYVIFNDQTEFYWSRSRILEKLGSLPAGTLPSGVQPALGPDATALGQIFWYTLEGRDPKSGKPNGDWTPQELRSLQDFQVKYALSAAEGVSEVATVGGYVREYQVDLDPDAMKSYGVTVMEVMQAVKKSNLDIGAETIELNRVEYIIRGLGYVKKLEDLENSVVSVRNNVPVRIRDVARVQFGPATRRGGLDKSGNEAVGAVVVARYGSNPAEVISHVKEKIAEMADALPQRTLPDGTISKVTVVPFYDRTHLIRETIGTLESALTHEILISILVIIVLVLNMRASLIVASLLPVGVGMTFILMHLFGVEANVVALSGIAIAIGVMVDIGIVDVENILRHLEMEENKGARGKRLLQVIYQATTEVRDAVVTSLATTVVSFLPVFAMEAAEGKLFHPLALTKTFALISAFVLGIVVLPTLAYLLYDIRFDVRKVKRNWNLALITGGSLLAILWHLWPAWVIALSGLIALSESWLPKKPARLPFYLQTALAILVALFLLSKEWLPLGAGHSIVVNFLFVLTLVALILAGLSLLIWMYEPILRWALQHKVKFLMMPLFTLIFGMMVWFGTEKMLGWGADGLETLGWHGWRNTTVWKKLTHNFPGLGKEFMPSLDEGTFLLMPTSMPHAGIEQNLAYVRELDRRVSTIPEVESSVGKWGRVASALDPAPVQMFENTISYKPEYLLDEDGYKLRFKADDLGYYLLRSERFTETDATASGLHAFVDRQGEPVKVKGTGEIWYQPQKQQFLAKNEGQPPTVFDSPDLVRLVGANPQEFLVAEKAGEYYRQWRPTIKNPGDIWDEIAAKTAIPGLTAAPRLQPIEARLVMLSTGLRAPMGLKITAPDAGAIEGVGLQLEKLLRTVPSINASSVFYDRAVGAPYLEIRLNREAMARYGMSVSDVQEVLQAAVGGMTLNTTVEGRERYPMRVRYARELRDNPEDLKKILIPTMNGVQIPLGELADLSYTKGEQMIRSENSFLTGYVIFDKKSDNSEVEVVEEAARTIRKAVQDGTVQMPKGAAYQFTGNYEHQIRAAKRLSLVIPLSLLLILLLLYFQFRTVTASLIHFSGVIVALSGGFLMIWLYSQSWFLNFSVAGVPMRALFHIHPVNLSVAVWVGFIALFGIATNDGVIMGTYLHRVFQQNSPGTVNEVREAVVLAGKRRVRPAMMTTAVAIIALLPVLTSGGKGSDIMIPMAIPTFGGMVIQAMTVFVVPLFQSAWRERALRERPAELSESPMLDGSGIDDTIA
ncbi:MAG: efflux RND transporter permease subunit [Marinilabiliales bacterium]|nr:efflux RND transporter permease subunit [Marinilabiliales bacterium]